MAIVKPEDFKRLISIDIPATAQALAFSPDGKLIAIAAGEKVHIYEIPKELQEEK